MVHYLGGKWIKIVERWTASIDDAGYPKTDIKHLIIWF
jgi:hypothetical protein